MRTTQPSDDGPKMFSLEYVLVPSSVNRIFFKMTRPWRRQYATNQSPGVPRPNHQRNVPICRWTHGYRSTEK